MTVINTTDTAREALYRLIEEAATTWEAYATARDRVTAAWGALQDTPAPLWAARILALLDAHDHAMGAAVAWDEVAHCLFVSVPLTGDDGTRITWREMADILGADATEWVIGTSLADYSAHRVRGPIVKATEDVHQGRLAHLATVRDLANMGDDR